MSLIDPNGVPVNDIGGNVIVPDDTPPPPPPRRAKWPLALLVLPLLAAGVFYGLSNKDSADTEDTATAPPRATPSGALGTSTAPSRGGAGASQSAIATDPSAAPRSASGAPTSTLRGLRGVARGEGGLVAMRHSLESDGWTVHWIAAQREARAWKAASADRKKWSEVRVTFAPNAPVRAMLMQKGPRGKILQSQSLPPSPAPRLRKGVLMAPSPLLGRATQKR